MVVIRMGRRRSSEALRIAASGERPSRRSASIATSIIMIAFFLTMPISRMRPMSAMTENSPFVTMSASTAPAPADGSVDRMVRGCTRLS